MTGLDWGALAACLALVTGVGAAFARRAGRSDEEYFVAGRSLPWWLAGTAMVATTFAVDAPMAVAELVARHGVAGNWLWWNLALSGLLTAFFFARLWHRAGVVTDAELVELRYGGRPAAVLRGVRAGVLAIPVNLLVLGWVNLAMAEMVGAALGVGRGAALGVCLLLAGAYAAAGGLRGVVAAGLVQFVLSLGGAVALAMAAVGAVGGMPELERRLAETHGTAEAALGLLPAAGGGAWTALLTVAVYLGVVWWTAWIPGAEPGGGGWVAQRILAARSERDGMLATLWFTVAHYALRPWPWIVVALCVPLLHPGAASPREGYARAVVELLPPGATGVVLGGFAVAYMATVATQLNWGAAYLVNDLWGRFLRPDAGPRARARAGRWATVALLLASAAVASRLGSIEGSWRFLMTLGAGVGPVLILRWYWWRINAWSELAAVTASAGLGLGLWFGSGLDPHDPVHWGWMVVATAAGTAVVWVGVALLTPPESQTVLRRFYLRVRPGGRGWRPVSAALGLAGEPVDGGPLNWTQWLAGVGLVYGTLAGVGKWIFGERLLATALLAVALACFLRIVSRQRPSRRSIDPERTPVPGHAS